jgi:hypothetical protein
MSIQTSMILYKFPGKKKKFESHVKRKFSNFNHEYLRDIF